jgi:hypothetical protein
VRSTGLESCAVDLIVQKAIDALARRDWRLLKTLLHPYLQWTDSARHRRRGRAKIMTWLEMRSSSGPPISYEVRDRQIYRWTDPATINPVAANRRTTGCTMLPTITEGTSVL